MKFLYVIVCYLIRANKYWNFCVVEKCVKNMVYTVEPRYSAPRYSANLDVVRKNFGPFNNKTFKIDLDVLRTPILCEKFSVPSIALYRSPTVKKFFHIMQKIAYSFREKFFYKLCEFFV
jgi:hypothetical protein